MDGKLHTTPRIVPRYEWPIMRLLCSVHTSAFNERFGHVTSLYPSIYLTHSYVVAVCPHCKFSIPAAGSCHPLSSLLAPPVGGGGIRRREDSIPLVS